MVSLTELCLPIFLSAVGVFIVSSILHMVIPIHKGDYGKLAGEEKVLEEMRAQGVKPGCYALPFAESMQALGSPEMIEKYNQGPVGYLTVVRNGPPRMGKNLIQWFLQSVLVSLFVAYATGLGLAKGADYMVVMRLAGTVAVAGYALGSLQDSIWKGQPWGITLKFCFDGVVYGLVTGGVFGWLWPSVS